MQSEKHAFVVRIWKEPAQSDSSIGRWRGSIDDVDSGKRSYFSDLDDM